MAEVAIKVVIITLLILPAMAIGLCAGLATCVVYAAAAVRPIFTPPRRAWRSDEVDALIARYAVIEPICRDRVKVTEERDETTV